MQLNEMSANPKVIKVGLVSDLTDVFQVLDVVSLCDHDLIDDVGSHLFFAG